MFYLGASTISISITQFITFSSVQRLIYDYYSLASLSDLLMMIVLACRQLVAHPFRVFWWPVNATNPQPNVGMWKKRKITITSYDLRANWHAHTRPSANHQTTWAVCVWVDGWVVSSCDNNTEIHSDLIMVFIFQFFRQRWPEASALRQ